MEAKRGAEVLSQCVALRVGTASLPAYRLLNAILHGLIRWALPSIARVP